MKSAPFNNRATLLVLVALWPGFLFDWALEWLLVIVLTLLGFLQFFSGEKRPNKLDRVGLGVMMFLICIALVSLVGTLFLQRFESGIRDIADAFKPFLFFFPVYFILALPSTSSTSIQRGALIVLIYSVACFFIVKFEVPLLSTFISYLYSDTKLQITEFTTRLSIPFENPNFFGFFSVVCLFLGLNSEGRLAIVLSVFSAICVALSGSRTAWTLGGVLLLFYIAETALRATQMKSKTGIFVVIFSMCLAVVFDDAIMSFAEDYKRLADYFDVLLAMDFSSDASYTDRDSLRADARDLIFERPFLGWGALKYSGLEVVDNQYYGLVLRYGFIGLVAIAFYAILSTRFFLAKLSGKEAKFKFIFMIAIVLAWLWAGSFLENIRLAILLIVLLNTYRSEDRHV